jgi:chromosome partitioning protein
MNTPRQAKTIAIATHKGGTGKTVTAMALGAGLARAGKVCLLIDLDPQGHSTLGLGVEVSAGEPTIREFFLSEPPGRFDGIVIETSVPHLYVVPADIRLARVAQTLYMRPKREDLLKRGIKRIETTYDYIVLDCPPSLGVLSEAAIAAADIVLVPCQMEARAADALVDLLEIISIIKGEEFNDWRILLTRVDQRKTVTVEAIMKALEPWKDRILKTTIPQAEALNQAQIARADIYSYDPKSKGAQAYEALTQEILRYGK